MFFHGLLVLGILVVLFNFEVSGRIKDVPIPYFVYICHTYSSTELEGLYPLLNIGGLLPPPAPPPGAYATEKEVDSLKRHLTKL